MYSNALTTPLATVGALAVTGPESMTTWVMAAGIAVTVGAGLLLRTRLLRRSAPAPRPIRRSVAPEEDPAPERTP